MGMATILVMWPGSFEQNFVPRSQGSSKWNLTLNGPVVSDEKMFKVCGRRRRTTDDGRRRPTCPTAKWGKWTPGASGNIYSKYKYWCTMVAFCQCFYFVWCNYDCVSWTLRIVRILRWGTAAEWRLKPLFSRVALVFKIRRNGWQKVQSLFKDLHTTYFFWTLCLQIYAFLSAFFAASGSFWYTIC